MAKEFLPDSKAEALDLGFFLDRKSYPGEEVLYIVNYTNSGRSKGLVFTIFLDQAKGGQVFNIQNNGRFVRSSKWIDFPDPPLGGIWTQEHIERAIKIIEHRSRYTLALKDLRITFTGIKCASYVDSFR